MGTIRLYFFFSLQLFPFSLDNLVSNVVCLSVYLFVFLFLFRTNENCTILGINKNTSPKIIRPRTKKYTSLTVWVCFFPHKWKLCNIGDKNISPKIIRQRKYTSFTALVKCRRGGWKITKQEKNRALKLLGPIGDKPPNPT